MTAGSLLRTFACVFSFLLLLAQPLRAQECDLPSLGAPVAAQMTTRFVPNGGVAQVLLKWPVPANVQVVEVDPADHRKPLDSKPILISTAPAGTTFESRGYGPEDSVLQFIVPSRDSVSWQRRAFIIRLCGHDKAPGAKAWAIVMPRVSEPFWAIVVSILVIALLYIAFVTIVYRIRNASHPTLEAKWPEYKKRRKYTWLENLDPVVLTANALNKGSIQKLQVLVFTMLVGGMVLALVLTSGFLPDFSPTVAMLLGISAVGAAVAQKTTASGERIKFDNWAWLVRRKVLPITRHQEDSPRWSDLVTTGREFDIYKLQTLLFSGVVAVALLANGGNALQSFAVPETLLGILGLSQVVYIAGSLVRPPSISELDNAITELRELEAKVATAVTQNTDTDSEGKLMPPPLPAGGVAGKNALEQYNKKANQVEVMLESTLETDIDRKTLDY